jgi:hypothetical protein
MITIRAAWMRFYPTLLTFTLIAQRALAFEGGAPAGVHGEGSAAQRPSQVTGAGGVPELEVIADEFAIPGVRFHVEVEPKRKVRAMYAYLPGVSKRRARLALDRESGRYVGDVLIPELLTSEVLTIRIVARDGARKSVERELRVPVLSDVCCDDEETCGLIPLPPEDEHGHGLPNAERQRAAGAPASAKQSS